MKNNLAETNSDKYRKSKDFMLTTPTHCVFRRGSVWLALPATVVREVVSRPPITPVPRTNGILCGLSHLRSEFIPVLNLNGLVREVRDRDEEFLIVIDDPQGDWGILVDAVHPLAVLEPSTAPEENQVGWESVVMGWANHEENIVRILDPIRFRELTQDHLTDSERLSRTTMSETVITK